MRIHVPSTVSNEVATLLARLATSEAVVNKLSETAARYQFALVTILKQKADVHLDVYQIAREALQQ